MAVLQNTVIVDKISFIVTPSCQSSKVKSLTLLVVMSEQQFVCDRPTDHTDQLSSEVASFWGPGAVVMEIRGPGNDRVNIGQMLQPNLQVQVLLSLLIVIVLSKIHLFLLTLAYSGSLSGRQTLPRWN